MYYIAEDGELTYIGGAANKDEWKTDLVHFSMYGVLTYKAGYGDVSANHWASEAINALSSQLIVTGMRLGEFAPDHTVTRAEFASLLSRMLGLRGEAELRFEDIPSGAWYAQDVALIAQAGIVQGTGGGRFEPNSSITRQEMAVMIMRAYQYAGGELANALDTERFLDSDSIASWAQESVRQAQALGFLNGRGNNRYAPAGSSTRAESAKLIYELMRRLPNRDKN